MDEIVGTTEAVRLFIHSEDDAAVPFVRSLLQNVFGKSEREAIELTAQMEENDRIACGPYPAPVAAALLESAQQFIRTARRHLLITSEAVRTHECDLCGRPHQTTSFGVAGGMAYLCNECLTLAREASDDVPSEEFRLTSVALIWHFAGIPQLVTRTRQFPSHMRADVQAAIDRLFAEPLHFFGIHEEYRYETMTFTRLMMQKRNPPAIAPPLYRDVDIGEDRPMKCLENGFWLCRSDELRYAVLLCAHRDYNGEAGLRIEIAVPTGAAGERLVQCIFGEWKPRSARRAPTAARFFPWKMATTIAANRAG